MSQDSHWKLHALWIAAGLLACCRSAFGGETLYNGIVLPDTWPPNVRSMGSDPSPAPYYLQSPPAVIPIDMGRQLFVDSFLIESTTLTTKYHAAIVHKNPVLTPDQPWESGVGSNPPSAMPFSGGVWYDSQDNLFKMWYTGGYNQSIAYAQSTDGLSWTKPNLDVVPGTNIVYSGAHDSNTVWLDQQATDPNQRFKMMLRDNASGQHEIRYSADGIHWSETVATTGAAFDRSTFFHNPFRDRWVLSLRGDVYDPAVETVSGDYAGRGELGGGMVSLPRMRRYAEGQTLVEAAQSWPTATFDSDPWYANTTLPTMWVGADSLDPTRPGGAAAAELYNLDGVAYESVMAGMFTIWQGARTDSPDRDKINYVAAGFSRDGFYWDRTNRDPIIDVSEDPDAWNYSNVQSAGGSMLTVGDQLYFYTSGRQGRVSGEASTGLSTMRRDGFAGMQAGQDEGMLTTRPVAFTGNYLFVNVDAVAGQLQAEILDENDNVIGPFSRQNSVSLTTDSTTAQMTWNGAGDLSSLAGQAVKFRFYLSNGELYSFWVSPDQSGASYGYVGAGGPGFTGATDTVGLSGVQSVSLKAAADTVISYRPDLQALNAGHATKAAIGTGGDEDDAAVALVRFDLSAYTDDTATGNGTLTLRQVPGEPSKNFHGQTLDLYAMPLSNADWQEGQGVGMEAVDGAAWNRMQGPYSLSPSNSDKWLPTDFNDATWGLELIDSIVWTDSLGSDSAVFTIPKEFLDLWLADGMVSFLIRSDSAEELLMSGDLTQRTWYAATLQTGEGLLAPRLSFTVVPEPSGYLLALGALFWGVNTRPRRRASRHP